MKNLEQQVNEVIETLSWGGIENSSPKQLRDYLESIGYDIFIIDGDCHIEWECTHTKLPNLFVDIWVEDFDIILGVING